MSVTMLWGCNDLPACKDDTVNSKTRVWIISLRHGPNDSHHQVGEPRVDPWEPEEAPEFSCSLCTRPLPPGSHEGGSQTSPSILRRWIHVLEQGVRSWVRTSPGTTEKNPAAMPAPDHLDPPGSSRGRALTMITKLKRSGWGDIIRVLLQRFELQQPPDGFSGPRPSAVVCSSQVVFSRSGDSPRCIQ